MCMPNGGCGGGSKIQIKTNSSAIGGRSSYGGGGLKKVVNTGRPRVRIKTSKKGR